jgi:hypothetical protein
MDVCHRSVLSWLVLWWGSELIFWRRSVWMLPGTPAFLKERFTDFSRLLQADSWSTTKPLPLPSKQFSIRRSPIILSFYIRPYNLRHWQHSKISHYPSHRTHIRVFIYVPTHVPIFLHALLQKITAIRLIKTFMETEGLIPVFIAAMLTLALDGGSRLWLLILVLLASLTLGSWGRR